MIDKQHNHSHTALAILYKGPCPDIPLANKTKQNKTRYLSSDNPTQTVEFHLRGLQIAAFVLAVVSGRLESLQAAQVLQSSL